MRDLIVKLAKHITDCMDITLGQTKMDESRPEYQMLDEILTDDMARLMLKMKVRKPYTAAELAKKIKWDEEKVQSLLDELAQIGIVEYNWHNEDRHKQYFIPVFVVGSSENLVYNKELFKKMPEKVGNFSYQMSYLPMESISHMVPPGGAGLGFHVIPVETAIPKDSQSLDIEHLSHWLEKYKKTDQFAIAPCQCRRAMTTRGEGCGELEDNVCILVGDYAQYLWETGKDVRRASYQEVVDTLRRCEENGYMHQITNGEGPDEIFGICNCTVGSCFGLRCSQLFNNPNCSASAYRARVTPENCVACGKCVEVCPTGAAKLGQKLCTSAGPIKYPTVTLPDETLDWGRKNWNYNYREDSQIQVYDTGTAPCKTACPAHIAIQGYVRMAAEGRYDEALALIKQDNPFPAVCGSICNKRCENACTRGGVDKPVSIDAIKKFIAERDLSADTRYVPKKTRHKGDEIDFTQKIAVIGAGPSGMSCAYFLAQMSYPVTVFDKDPIPGGMLTKGIPSFRLEKDIVNAEIEVLKELGVEFRCGVEVGRDVTIAELREQGYLMKELSTRLVMGKLAVDLSDEIPEIQWNGSSIAFPVYTRSAAATVISAKGSVVPVEIDGSSSNATIKHYAASVKWHRDTIRQSGGKILADMGLIDLAESMAQKLDADLVAECLSGAVLKSALAAADSMTQAELEAGFALFGDKQSVTEFGGVVLNSKLFPSLLAMDGFSSESKTYTEAGNGIVLGQICGFYRGIPCYLSDNGTRPTISTTPESRVIILKKNALGYALKKAIDFDESYNNTTFYTTVTTDTYGAQKLIDTDKCVILGKTLSA